MTASDAAPERLILVCLSCGNTGRFEEIASLSVNIINGDMTYIRNVCNDVSEYRCYECGSHTDPSVTTIPHFAPFH